MNFKTTLTLIVLLAIVGGYWLAFERGREAPEAEPISSTDEGTLLLDPSLSAAQFERLTVERDGTKALIEREDGQWVQTAPVRFPLQTSAVDNVINTALSLRYMQQFTPGGERPTLEQAALGPARATLTLQGAEKSVTLKLGDQYGGGHAYLARNGGESIYVVDNALHQKVLEDSVRDWRETSLTGLKASAADRVTMKGDERSLELVKRDGQWYLGEGERGAEDAVSQVTDAIRTASVEAFVADSPEDLSLYGLANPRLQVVVQADEETETTENAGHGGSEEGAKSEQAENRSDGTNKTVLRIGQAAGLGEDSANYFASWSNGNYGEEVVFTVSKRLLDDLRMDVDALRDPQIATVKADEVKRLQVERSGKQNIDISRDPSAGYAFGQPAPGYSADYEAVRGLIEAVVSAEATGYEPGFQPASEPKATITLTHRGSGESEKVKLYEDSADGGEGSDSQTTHLAVREHEPVAYRLEREAIAGIFEPLLALRDKTIYEFDSDAVSQIELRRADGVTYRFEKTGESQWELAEHDKFEADAFDKLRQALRPLRVERWVSDTVEPGDDAIKLALRGESDEPTVLRVDPKSRRGTMSGVDTDFVLSQELVNRLNSEYRERTVLNLHSEELARLHVLEHERGEDQESQPSTQDELSSQLRSYDPEQEPSTGTLIERDGDQFRSTGEVSVGEATAGALFDRLGGLEVKRYEATGEISDVSRRIRGTTDAGETFELVLMGDGQEAWLHGRLNGARLSRWVTFTESAAESLMQPLSTDTLPEADGPAMPPGAGPPRPGDQGQSVPPAVQQQIRQQMQQQRSE